MLAYENGDEFMRAWFDAAAGKLDPFILVLEGSVPNEEINGEGHWAGLGVDPGSRQPIPTSHLDRPARAEGRGGARARHVRRLRRDPGDAQQPDRRDGPARLPRLGLGVSRSGSRSSTCPGCPVQPDNITETLLCLVLHLARMGPALELDEQGRPRRIFGRTVHESCNRAGHGRAAASSLSATETAAAWSSSDARVRWSSATCRSAAG